MPGFCNLKCRSGVLVLTDHLQIEYNLYKERNVVRKNVAEAEAVQALIDLIKENGDWVELTH